MPQVVAARGASRQDYRTPPWILDLVRRVGPIALDPCTDASNPTGAESWITPHTDGLLWDWGGPGGLVYVNPPWREASKWVGKCVMEADLGVEIIYLGPPATDTKYFHNLILPTAGRVWFSRGRVAFINPETGQPDRQPPGGVLMAYWGPRGKKFTEVFRPHGWVV